MYIDYSYQRVSNINKLVDNWDYRKCSLLTVNYRESEHKFYVINGVHRVYAAKRNDTPVLPCEIFYNLSVSEEAYLFSTQDDDVEKVTTFDKYKANLLWEEENSIILKEMCDKYNIIVSGRKGDRKETGCLKALADTLNFFVNKKNENQKKKALDWIFNIYDKCGWRNDPLGLSGKYIVPITSVYNTTKDEQLEDVANVMIETLRNFDVKTIQSYATMYYPFVGGDHNKKISVLFKDIASGEISLSDMVENIKNNVLYRENLLDIDWQKNREIALRRCGKTSNTTLAIRCLSGLSKIKEESYFRIKDFLNDNEIHPTQFGNLKTRNPFIKDIFDSLKTDKMGVYYMTNAAKNEIQEYVSMIQD